MSGTSKHWVSTHRAAHRRRWGLWAPPIALLVAVVLTACHGDDTNPELPASTRQQVDQLVMSQMETARMPGVVIRIEIPGQGSYTQAYGTANLDTQQARSVDDPFRIASITKTFTATAILQLIGQGKLALTDTVSKWYPTFPNGDRITVDDLLRMRSGIVDSANEAFLAEYYANPLEPITADEMIERAAALSVDPAPPNTATVYTNVNFMLLQRIAELVDGRPINEQLTTRVYKPLALGNTLYPDSTQTGLNGRNRGYSYEAGSQSLVDKTVLNPEPPGGAGAMISTVLDLAVYARAMCTDSGLVPANLQRQRLQGASISGAPDFVKYGAGVELFGQFCGHNGTIMGFSSEMFYLPARDAVIVVNVNRLDLDDKSQSTELFLLLTKLLFPDNVNW